MDFSSRHRQQRSNWVWSRPNGYSWGRLPSDVSSVRSDSVSTCCSEGSSVYLPMLCSSSGTLVQCCIGEMSRSGSWSRWHRSSCPHHCTTHTSTHLISSSSYQRLTLRVLGPTDVTHSRKCRARVDVSPPDFRTGIRPPKQFFPAQIPVLSIKTGPFYQQLYKPSI